MSRIIIKAKDLVDEVKFLTSNFTYNKLYQYSNYFECYVEDNKFVLRAPLIIGEAVGTGLVESRIDCTVYGEEEEAYSIPIEALREAMKAFAKSDSDADMEITTEVTRVNLISGEVEARVPKVATEIPVQITDKFDAMQEVLFTEGSIVEVEELAEKVKVSGKGLNNSTIDFAYFGMYFHETGLYTFNGISLDVDLDLPPAPFAPFYNMFIPAYMQKQLATMRGLWMMVRKQIGEHEFVMMSLGGRTVLFQEWFSKPEYPIDALVQLSQQEGIKMDATEVIPALVKVSAVSKVVVIDGPMGNIRDTRGKIKITSPTLTAEVPEVMYRTAELPKNNGYSAFNEVSIVQGHVPSLLLKGETRIKLVAPTIES